MMTTAAHIFLKSTCILSILITSTIGSRAQQDPEITTLIESLAEGLPEDYDFSELVEQLAYYKKHPVDLNNTTPQELKKLFILSPLQISNLFSHFKTNGKLLDLLELQSIDGFDVATIQRLLPFVNINLPAPFTGLSFKHLLNKGSNDLILRYAQTLEKQKGFNDLPGSRYLGNPLKLLGKYRYTYSNLISASFVFKKDAGEYLFSGNNKTAFDFMSVHVALYNIGKIKKLVLGDYSLQFGQGLTLWSGFGYGKGPDVTSVAKKDVGLKAYTSSNESSFFRGIASTLGLLEHIDLTTFVSFRKLDASLSTSKDGQLSLVNIGISGLHRTATEIKNKGSEAQLIYGAVVQYLSDNLNVGLVGYHSNYQHPFSTGNQDYNAYGFTGTALNNAGLHYSYTFRNVYLYGEAASSLDGGNSVVNGAMASISRTCSIVMVHRYYQQNYHSFFGQSLGEGSDGSNERGFYAGFNFNPNKRWSFSVYNDYFNFPWLKYRVDEPSAGFEVLGQITYTPIKTFKSVLRYKRKLTAQNPDDKSAIRLTDNVVKENFRAGVEWRSNKKFGFQNRLEAARYKKGESKREIGYLIYQDVTYSPLSSKFSANMRVAYFRTPSYNSRVYAYEDDVLYGFSFGMYNGHGFRTYLNLKYHLGKRLNLWSRYAISIYPGETTVGSGLDQIAGNKKSEIKLQLRYEF